MTVELLLERVLLVIKSPELRSSEHKKEEKILPINHLKRSHSPGAQLFVLLFLSR